MLALKSLDEPRLNLLKNLVKEFWKMSKILQENSKNLEEKNKDSKDFLNDFDDLKGKVGDFTFRIFEDFEVFFFGSHFEDNLKFSEKLFKIRQTSQL